MTDGNLLATTTTVVSLEKINLHPRNVRQGDVGAISESLDSHGQYRPLVVQKSTGNILAGNHTYKAARALGWSKIAVTYVDVDDNEALRILLVDNRSNDLASYDENALAELLTQLAATEQQLNGTGYDTNDLDDLLHQLATDPFTQPTHTTPDKDNEQHEGIRTILLPYTDSMWHEVTAWLAELREQLGVDSDAAVVAEVLRRACT